MAVVYLDTEDLMGIAQRVVGTDVAVRDRGLLHAAAVRPAMSAFGSDAYPDLYAKTAALMQSIAKNHALVDGNKRLCLAGGIVTLGINGRRLTLTNDEAYDLIIEVAAGGLQQVDDLAVRLESGSEQLED